MWKCNYYLIKTCFLDAKPDLLKILFLKHSQLFYISKVILFRSISWSGTYSSLLSSVFSNIIMYSFLRLVPLEVFVTLFFNRCNIKFSTLVFIYCSFLNLHHALVSYFSNEYRFVIQVKITTFLCQNTIIYAVELSPFPNSVSI